jgi:hypothetical protein
MRSADKVILVVFIMLLAYMLISCSSASKTNITGKWKTIDSLGNGDITEFTSTGGYIRTYFDQRNGKTIRGTYSFIDSSRLEISSDFIDDVPIKTMQNVKLGPLLCVVKIRGDKLELTSPNGEIEHYEKLKEP